MEVIENSSEQLSNRQVLDLLKSYTSKKQTNLATILYETSSYLESSPAASSPLTNVASFLDVLKKKKYDLTKMEKIQLVNLKPQNEIELNLIIDNIDEKLTEDQRSEILDLLKTHLEQPVVKAEFDHDSKRLKV